MGLSIDKKIAKERLARAVEWAKSDRPVPSRWLEVARQMQESSIITYTPALGTALLARATDSRVDPLSIKATYGSNTYSQRTLCHGVLVPAAVEYGFSIRNTGREPLNNQPFFRYDHISLIERVHGSAQEALAQLRAALEELKDYSTEDALGALAAFLRVRFEMTVSAKDIPFLGPKLGVDKVIRALNNFLESDIDRPRRTQAVVAASFDMIYPVILTRRINDPSRDFPGDVQAIVDEKCIMAAEARAKPVPASEVQTYVATLRLRNIARGFVVAIHPSHAPVSRDLISWAWSEHRVVLNLVESTAELVWAIVTWSAHSVDELLSRFLRAVSMRLREIEALDESLLTWNRILSAQDEE